MKNIIFHIDVNNAFLSWTAVKLLNEGYNIDIRNIVSVIGGDEEARSGIVLAKSTPAKKLGITSAETLYQAKKKAPNLKVYKPDYKYYEEMSNKLFNLLQKYSPDIEVASIDECYLDYGKVRLLYGDEMQFAQKLQKEINDELGFTVNIGIANNKLCAKMASDFEKPNKIHTLYNYEIEEKMYPLPIGDLFGIGKKTVIKLNEIGIYTIADLANYNDLKLKRYFKNQATHMINIARGIDNSYVNSEAHIPKGIGHEFTLVEDSNNKEFLYEQLFLLANMTARRLRSNNKYAKVICVVIKDVFFKRKSHQRKLKNATNTTNEIYKHAKEIFDEFYDNEPIRLIGIRLDNLVDDVEFQVSLFESYDYRQKEEKIDSVVDDINLKYGCNIVKKASLLNINREK
ncbi:MAG: DNA polymerase IV [Bacilli bacterium]|jgi:DNA polymerase-4|nr:DNA polymerase IV [Bacilli bacterium]